MSGKTLQEVSSTTIVDGSGEVEATLTAMDRHRGTLTSFPYFMKLPLEIRTIIYEYVLCPGIVYVYAKDICRGDLDYAATHSTSTYRDLDRECKKMPGPAHDQKNNRRMRYMEWEHVRNDRIHLNQALLRGISKAVQVEATAVFYGPKNHFVLPCGSYDFPETSGHKYRYSFVVPNIPPFHSMSVST